MVPSGGFLRIKNGGDSKSIQFLARSCEPKVSRQRSGAVKSVILLRKFGFSNRQCVVLVWQR